MDEMHRHFSEAYNRGDLKAPVPEIWRSPLPEGEGNGGPG